MEGMINVYVEVERSIKNVDYTIPGARVVEDSILEYEGPQEKLKNKHDKDIIEKIIELSEKEEIRKKP